MPKGLVMSPVEPAVRLLPASPPAVTLPVSGITLIRLGDDEDRLAAEARASDGALLGVLLTTGELVSGAWRGLHTSGGARPWAAAVGPAPLDGSLPDVWFLRRKPGTRFLVRVPVVPVRAYDLWAADCAGPLTAVYVRSHHGQSIRQLLPVTDAVRLHGRAFA